jgi:hypothetical protein
VLKNYSLGLYGYFRGDLYQYAVALAICKRCLERYLQFLPHLGEGFATSSFILDWPRKHRWACCSFMVQIENWVCFQSSATSQMRRAKQKGIQAK